MRSAHGNVTPALLTGIPHLSHLSTLMDVFDFTSNVPYSERGGRVDVGPPRSHPAKPGLTRSSHTPSSAMYDSTYQTLNGGHLNWLLHLDHLYLGRPIHLIATLQKDNRLHIHIQNILMQGAIQVGTRMLVRLILSRTLVNRLGLADQRSVSGGTIRPHQSTPPYQKPSPMNARVAGRHFCQVYLLCQ